MRYLLGRSYYANGRFEEANQELREVLRTARRYRNVESLRAYSVELAMTLAHQGDFRSATKLLESLPPRVGDAPANLIIDTRIRLGQAEVAIEAGQFEAARKFAQAAQDLLKTCPNTYQEAYKDATCGRLESLCGGPQAHSIALAYFEKAEAAFRNAGADGIHGIAKTLVARGHLHLLGAEGGRV